MLEGLLSKEECAQCRLCCSFDSYGLWDTPVITPGMKEKVLRAKPGQRFVSRGDTLLLRMEREEQEDLYYCPLLDRSRGCIMGDGKPFDCRIWPFRVMNFLGRRVITLSPLCPAVAEKPVEQIRKKCGEIAPAVFKEAREHPEYVRAYEEGFPIFAADTAEE